MNFAIIRIFHLTHGHQKFRSAEICEIKKKVSKNILPINC